MPRSKPKTRDGEHGGAYRSWCSMQQRVLRDPRYAGVTICKRWLGPSGFQNFLADMGDRPKGMTIDRRDNEGNYEPGNCRWATQKEQSRNRSTNKLYTINGETKSLGEWAEIYGIRSNRVANRIKREGMTIKQALTKPTRNWGEAVTIEGVTHTINEWCRNKGIERGTLSRRIKRGWSMEKAIMTPVRGHK